MYDVKIILLLCQNLLINHKHDYFFSLKTNSTELVNQEHKFLEP